MSLRMDDSKRQAVDTDRRGGERVPFAAKVTLRFETAPVAAAGQNISGDGALFVLGEDVPVRVQVEGEAEERRGVLVRMTPHGGGKMGVAVRFLQPG